MISPPPDEQHGGGGSAGPVLMAIPPGPAPRLQREPSCSRSQTAPPTVRRVREGSPFARRCPVPRPEPPQ